VKRILWILLLLGLVAALVWRIVAGSKAAQKKEQGGPGKQPAPVTVITAASGGAAGVLSISGTLRAPEQVQLRAEAAGRVVWLNMPEGARVEAGTLLARINDAELRALRKKITAQLQLAEQRLNRLRTLRNAGGVSADELESAEQEQASLQAELEQTDAKLALCELKAPFSGVLGLRRISNGSIVSTQDVFSTLTQMEGMQLDFSLPALYAASVVKGNKIAFTGESSGDTFQATVIASEAALDEQTRTLTVRAQVQGQHQVLKPGMFCKVLVTLTQQAGSISLPTEALVPVMRGYQVYVVKQGKATPVPIEITERTEQNVIVKRGLQVGDSVITRGLLGLRPGAQVRVVNR
jgi:membrane fusion protein (multidrug efflux system)